MLSFTLAHQLLTLICASYVGVFTFGSGTCLIFARCFQDPVCSFPETMLGRSRCSTSGAAIVLTAKMSCWKLLWVTWVLVSQWQLFHPVLLSGIWGSSVGPMFLGGKMR